jgi:hypothetical protein
MMWILKDNNVSLLRCSKHWYYMGDAYLMSTRNLNRTSTPKTLELLIRITLADIFLGHQDNETSSIRPIRKYVDHSLRLVVIT